MSGLPSWEELRPRAFAVAYRMLGSVSEAEDIVQEALLRLHFTMQQGDRIESPHDEDGIVVLLERTRAASRHDAARECEYACPSKAITISGT